MEQASAMPFPTADYKPMRDGLRDLKSECTPAHPVEQIEKQATDQSKRYGTVRSIYGSAMAARMQIHEQLAHRERLGGLPSSGLGIKTLRGGFETLSPQDFLNVPELDPHMTADFHAIVDRQQGTKPL